jgi:class 3 adenylate cyclase
MECPKCRFENQDGFQYCAICDYKIKGFNAGEKYISVFNGERKRVTALFSDISSYTAMTEKLGSEKIKEVTSKIFDKVRKIIRKYDGSIERFDGDGFLALFGVPTGHEDDPVRAIHAAIEIHEFVDTFSPPYGDGLGIPLSLHSGINTGLAITPDENSDKGTPSITGDAINVAARLCEIASAKEIFVGQGTYQFANNQFEFKKLVPQRIKGKSEPIKIYKLISIKTSNPLIHDGRRIFSKMVGRDRELDILDLQVLKLINGEGSVVDVVGEAGIGKSRLIKELKNREVIKRVTFLEGRAISIGKNLSFHPIIDLIKQWAFISEEDTDTSAFKKLGRAIRSIDSEESEEILPFVATMMGLKLKGHYAQRIRRIEGEALEKLIIKNIRTLLIKGSNIRPIIVVWEDLHWADMSSIELIDILYQLVEKHRILFINIFRPGDLEEKNSKILTISKRLPIYHVEIEIRPLKTNDSVKLIQNILNIKGLPYSMWEQIITRSGGNPFFIEEIVRSLIDQEVIIGGGSGFQVTEKIDNVYIPPTINDVLIARIDRLDVKTKDLVKVASIIGRSFYARIIKDVASSIDEVDYRLAFLKDVQLITDRVRMKELEYLFQHALVQEAAYESTLIQQRKVLHVKVAKSIEKIFNKRLNEFYGMLAFHYGKGDDLNKSEEYLIKAGEEALRLAASSEALSYLHEALRLYLNRSGENTRSDKLTSLKKKLSLAHFNRGHWSEALFYIDDILSNKGYKFPQSKFRSYLKLCFDFIYIWMTLTLKFPSKRKVPNVENIEEFELIVSKLFCLTHVDSSRFITECLSAIRITLSLQLHEIPQGMKWAAYSSAGFILTGLPALGARMLQRSEDIAYSKNQHKTIELDWARSVYVWFGGGSWVSAPKFDSSIVDLALKQGNLTVVSFYIIFQALLKSGQGSFDTALIYSKKLLQIAENFAYDSVRIEYHRVRSDIFIRNRHLVEALKDVQEGLLLADQTVYYPHQLLLFGYQAIAYSLIGKNMEARLAIKKGELLLSNIGTVVSHWIAPLFFARLLIDLELLKLAVQSNIPSNVRIKKKICRRSVKQAMSISKKYAPFRTWIITLKGTYLWITGKQKNALKCWKKAIKHGLYLGAHPDLARTYYEIGKRLLEPQSKIKNFNGIDAYYYLDKAREMFEEMDLQYDLNELDQLSNYNTRYIQ